MSEGDNHLKELILTILSEREKTSELTAHNLELRLQNLNELREQVLSDRTRYLDSAVYNQMHKALDARVSKVENAQSRLIGVGATLIILSGAVGAVIGHFWK